MKRNRKYESSTLLSLFLGLFGMKLEETFEFPKKLFWPKSRKFSIIINLIEAEKVCATRATNFVMRNENPSNSHKYQRCHQEERRRTLGQTDINFYRFPLDMKSKKFSTIFLSFPVLKNSALVCIYSFLCLTIIPASGDSSYWFYVPAMTVSPLRLNRISEIYSGTEKWSKFMSAQTIADKQEKFSARKNISVSCFWWKPGLPKETVENCTIFMLYRKQKTNRSTLNANLKTHLKSFLPN